MRKYLSKMDIPLLILMIFFSVLGLVMVLSASSVSAVLRYGVSSYHFFTRQLLFILAAFILGFIIILRLPTVKYKYFTPILLIGIMTSLAGLFVYGKIAGGAQSWYSLGFFNLQPTEFAKSIIVIYMAVYYNRIMRKPSKNKFAELIPIIVSIIMFILIAMQPDFGGAIILAGIVFLIFLIVPIEKGYMVNLMKFVGVGVIIAIILFMNIVGGFNNAQLARFNYKNPCSRYQDDTGYQVCNGYIAMHNGGLLGVGLGNSSQKYLYLPEAHTDFIFPILVEELGLLFGVFVIICYIILLYRILKISKNASTLRGSILAYGTFAMILIHLLINFLGVLAVIPLTGVPVPLLSYGGSFTINVLIMLFITQRVAIESKIAKEKIAIR